MRAVERDVLDPEVVEAALRLAPSRHAVAWRECASPRRAQGRTGANRDAAGALEAIADAGPLDTILAAIKAREHEAIIRELRMLTLKAGPEDIGEIRLTLRQ
jgi:hypothetical protein